VLSGAGAADASRRRHHLRYPTPGRSALLIPTSRVRSLPDRGGFASLGKERRHVEPDVRLRSPAGKSDEIGGRENDVEARARRHLERALEQLASLDRAVVAHRYGASRSPLLAQQSASRSGLHLTVSGAAAIAVSALVVFGLGIAVSHFAFPSSRARSFGSTIAQTRTTMRPAPTPVQRTRTSEIAPPEITEPRGTIRKAAHKPRGASDQVPVATPALQKPPTAAAPAQARQAKSPIAPTHPGTKAGRAVRPIPHGGYVFAEGRFQVSGNGRTIVDFMLTTSCAGNVTLPPIQVRPTGKFAFLGYPTAPPPRTTVRLSGHFASPTEARGTAAVTRDTCRDPTTAFVAHLS
jgi:hypothetical protein